MRKLLLPLLVVLPFQLTMAQLEEKIKGTVLDSKTRIPLQAVVARLAGTANSSLTDLDGHFVLHPLALGACEIELSFPGYINKRITVDVSPLDSLDLGHLFLEEDWTSQEQLGLISLEDTDLNDTSFSIENTTRLLQATKDAFQQTAAYTWSQGFYRTRGLDNSYSKTLLNGLVMNKMFNGRPQWSNWGGLNDATRNQVFYSGSIPAPNSFGGILGTQVLVTRASQMRKGTRIGIAGTTTTYEWKPYFSYASGLMRNNWAYSFSGSYRGAAESYWPGSNYDALSFFVGIEKKVNEKHLLYFSGIYAKNKRAKNSSNTLEQTRIKGITYNSYWGWQAGKKRNARYQDIQEPFVMLTHEWTFNEQSKLTTTVGYQWGYTAQSRLDYQDNLNPDPAYYKNLPSYYLTQIDATYWQMPSDEFNALPEDDPFKQSTLAALQQADQVQQSFSSHGQIDWQELYKKNTHFNGQSKIVLFEDRQEDQTAAVNATFNTAFTDHITLYAGINYRNLQSSNFKKLVDLLGGTYYKDIDSYQKKELQDSDLNHPNRTVYTGDRYGYNFRILADELNAFTQLVFHYSQLDFYFAENIGFTNYQRVGLYQNPNHSSHSYGVSERVHFNTIGIKGGLTYYLTGKHLLQANFIYASQAPSIQHSFANIRVSNEVTPDLKLENNFGIEGSYRFRSARLQARFTGYYTEIRNNTQLNFYYTEGTGITDSKGALVSELATHVNTRYIGVEFGASYALTSTIKISTTAGLGQAYYTNNPNFYIQAENTVHPLNLGKANLANYRISNGPQTALSVGLEYRAPSFWSISSNLSYLADAFVRISPLRRTQNFISDPDKMGHPYAGITPEKLHQIVKQEKLPAFTLLSFTGGKSWRLRNRSIFGFFATIQNVFNTTYRTGGFEQSRNATYAQEMERTKGDHSVFGSKYWYGYGRNFFLQLYYNF